MATTETTKAAPRVRIDEGGREKEREGDREEAPPSILRQHAGPTGRTRRAGPQRRGGREALQLGFKDFVPTCLLEGKYKLKPLFHGFSDVVTVANTWLQNNPEVRVRTCETLDRRSYDSKMDTERLVYPCESRDKFYVRALRLWISPKAATDSPEPQTIAVHTFVPRQPQLLEDRKALAVKILNVEPREIPLWGKVVDKDEPERSVDAEGTCWADGPTYSSHRVMVERIFFEEEKHVQQERGCERIDFLPDITTPSGESVPTVKCQSVSDIVRKANIWLRENQVQRIINCKTFHYRLPEGLGGNNVEFNSFRTCYWEEGNRATQFIMVLRLYYTKPVKGAQPPTTKSVTYRTFLPEQLAEGKGRKLPIYETTTQLMRRVQEWLDLTGAALLAIESVPVWLYKGEPEGSPEVTYRYHPISGKEGQPYAKVYAIRTFLDGAYRDPPIGSMHVRSMYVESSRKSECSVM